MGTSDPWGSVFMLALLQILLVALRLFGVLSWSWILVLGPMWMPAVLFSACLTVAALTNYALEAHDRIF